MSLQHETDFPEAFNENGFLYKLLKIKGKKGVYEQTKNDRVIALEVITLRKATGTGIWAAKTPYLLPRDEDFGKIAWTYAPNLREELLKDP